MNELASTVTVFAFEPDAGTLRAIQSLPTLPRGFAGTNTAAEIAVDARGRFLYVSNRGHDSIAVFAIAPGQGTLTPLERVPSGGSTPRHLALDPTGRWLFAANQGSDSVTLFRVDRKAGRLRPAGRPLSVTSPVCVQFVVLDQEPWVTAPCSSRPVPPPGGLGERPATDVLPRGDPVVQPLGQDRRADVATAAPVETNASSGFNSSNGAARSRPA